MLGSRKKCNTSKIDTLIGANTEIQGDLHFNGGLHVDGRMRGNVIAEGAAVLMLSENGHIEGDVRVPGIVLNGTVIGDVYASERVELAAKARVTGNVYYNLIEMAMGAEVNGKLVHHAADQEMPVVTDDPEVIEPTEGNTVIASNS